MGSKAACRYINNTASNGSCAWDMTNSYNQAMPNATPALRYYEYGLTSLSNFENMGIAFVDTFLEMNGTHPSSQLPNTVFVNAAGL